MKKCRYCNRLNDDTSMYCGGCGRPLFADRGGDNGKKGSRNGFYEPGLYDRNDPDYGRGYYPEYDRDYESDYGEGDHDNNIFQKILIAILVVLIIAALGVGIFVVVRGLSEKREDPDSNTALYENTEEETEKEDDEARQEETEATTEYSWLDSQDKGFDIIDNDTDEEDKDDTMNTSKPDNTQTTTATQSTDTTETPGNNTEYKKGQYQDYEGFLFPDSHERYLNESEAGGLSKTEVQKAINEIYARKNYKFTKKENADYFSQYSWYQPRYTEEKDLKFNTYESANIALLSKYR